MLPETSFIETGQLQELHPTGGTTPATENGTPLRVDGIHGADFNRLRRSG